MNKMHILSGLHSLNCLSRHRQPGAGELSELNVLYFRAVLHIPVQFVAVFNVNRRI